MSPTRKAGGPGRAQPAPIGTDVPWFEIELIDADGRPVVGQRYEVHGPDGVRVVGHTRPDGRALIVGVAADRCRVFLPDLDAEWTEIWQQ